MPRDPVSAMTRDLTRAAVTALRKKKGPKRGPGLVKKALRAAMLARMAEEAQRDDRRNTEEDLLEEPPAEEPEPEAPVEEIDDQSVEEVEQEAEAEGPPPEPGAETLHEQAHDEEPLEEQAPTEEPEPEMVEAAREEARADSEPEESPEGGGEQETETQTETESQETHGGGAPGHGGGEPGTQERGEEQEAEGEGEEVATEEREAELGEGEEVEEGEEATGEAPTQTGFTPREFGEVHVAPEDQVDRHSVDAVIGPDGAGHVFFEGRPAPQTEGDEETRTAEVPHEIVQANEAERAAHAQEMVDEFLEHGQTGLDDLTARGAEIRPRLEAKRDAAKAQVAAAMQQAIGRITGAIDGAIGQANAAAQQATEQATQKHAQLLQTIQQNAEASRGTLEADATAAEGRIDEMRASFETQINQAFSTADTNIRAAGTEIGDQAVTAANSRAQQYGRQALPSRSWVRRKLEGEDYERNKRRARVQAAQQVGTQYKEEFVKKANEAADGLSGGSTELFRTVDEHITAIRGNIQNRKTTGIEAITQEEGASVERANELLQQSTEQIETARAQNISGLEALKTSKVQQARSTGRSARSTIDQRCEGSITALEGSIEAPKRQLEELLTRFQEESQGCVAPDEETLRQELDKGRVQIDTIVETANTMLESGLVASEEQLDQVAQQMVQGLNDLAATTTSGATGVVGQFQATLQQIQGGIDQGFSGILDGFAQTTQQQLDQARTDYDQQVTDLQTSMTTAEGNVVSKLTEIEGQLRGDFNNTLAGIQGKITEEANKAADKVKPAWKSVLAFVLKIIIAIAVAVAIGLLIASGVGIGLLLLGGALIGAAGGALSQLVTNWENNDPAMTGMAGAIIGGAIGGMVSAATGGLASGWGGSIGAAVNGVAGRFASAGLQTAVTYISTAAINTGFNTLVSFGQAVVTEAMSDQPFSWGNVWDSVVEATPANIANGLAGSFNFPNLRAPRP